MKENGHWWQQHSIYYAGNQRAIYSEASHPEEVSIEVASVDQLLHQLVRLADELLFVPGHEHAHGHAHEHEHDHDHENLWKRNWSTSSLSLAH